MINGLLDNYHSTYDLKGKAYSFESSAFLIGRVFWATILLEINKHDPSAKAKLISLWNIVTVWSYKKRQIKRLLNVARSNVRDSQGMRLYERPRMHQPTSISAVL